MKEALCVRKELWRYAMRTRKSHIIWAPVVFLVVLFYIFLFTDGTPRTDWWSIVEPITGLMTLTVAFLVWCGEFKQDWFNSLPKRLTVQFVYKFSSGYRIVLRCAEAYLAGEDDIRAWGQQLGGQMADGEQLKFQPYIYVQEEPCRENIRRYTVTFVLNSFPEKHGLGKVPLSAKGLCDLNDHCLLMAYNPSTDAVERTAIAQGPWARPETR